MNNIKISVIIPIYNAEKYLKKCIESILSQTFKELEIILINDGSKDNSHDICKKFEQKDKRILYINKYNEGCSRTRNLGISIAKGEYITFVDSDDYIEKDMYKNMYRIAKENNSDIVICGFYILNKKHEIIEKILPKEYLKKKDYFKIENKCFNSPCNKLYRKKIIEKNSVFFPEKTHMGEDMVFNVKIFYFANKINIIKEAYYNYYDNIFGVMNTVEKRKEIYKSLDEIYIFLNKYSKNNEYLKVFNEIFIFHGIKIICGVIENLKNEKNKKYKEFMILLEKNINKYYKNFTFKQQIYIFYRKRRINFYFLKPIAKKYWNIIKKELKN